MRACALSVMIACAAASAATAAADATPAAAAPEKSDKAKASADAKSADIVAPAPSSGGATVIYRQVLPNGRIVYSDKQLKDARLDHTLTVEPPIHGNLWTTESGARPEIPPQTKPTPIRKVNVAPVNGQKKTAADAESEVIRAEMLLEDAKKRQQAGLEPQPGERSGTAAGASRLNEDYSARQKALAREVEDAESALRQAIAERDALEHAR